MPNIYADTYTLMVWPWTQTQNNRDWLKMMEEAREVVTARMPTLWQAFLSPWQADYGEIGLMWSEKSAAFAQSSKAVERAGRHVKTAGKAQQKAISKTRSGQMVTFFDLMELYQRNMTAMASLVSIPTSVLKPVKSRVSANAKRLGAI